jgi:hypothetical protein
MLKVSFCDFIKVYKYIPNELLYEKMMNSVIDRYGLFIIVDFIEDYLLVGV